ncbi:hypothetical protein N7524_003904 [Penicillium chrysogenum]|nr:hypothetical protein N7524_003904 [Penicillium chrysogenum]
MDKKYSIRFYYPGCERENFRSLVGVRNHFLEKRHSFQCPICEKTFQDEMAIIQHYQSYYTKPASPDRPSDIYQVSPPSVLSNAAVTPIIRSISVHTDTLEEPSRPSEQRPEIPALPGIASNTTAYPTDINLLEQNLILRYLRPTTIRNRKRPRKGSIPTYQFRETPRIELQAAGTICAIAINYKIVGVRNGRQALAFLSAINFLTSEVLISRYMNPSEERYKFSSVTQGIITSAIASSQEARDKLWEFIDDSTVLHEISSSSVSGTQRILKYRRKRLNSKKSRSSHGADKDIVKGHNTVFHDAPEDIRWWDPAEEFEWSEGYDPWSD